MGKVIGVPWNGRELMWEEQELNDDEGWRGFTVNEKEHNFYVLEFKRVSQAGEGYLAQSPRAVIIALSSVFAR